MGSYYWFRRTQYITSIGLFYKNVGRFPQRTPNMRNIILFTGGIILLVMVGYGKDLEIKKLNLYIKVKLRMEFQMVKEH